MLTGGVYLLLLLGSEIFFSLSIHLVNINKNIPRTITPAMIIITLVHLDFLSENSSNSILAYEPLKLLIERYKYF